MMSANFCKREVCPSSADLLAFLDEDFAPVRREAISSHLSVCEFCSAEVDLYVHYPQADDLNEAIAQTTIPAPLFELAEALLKKRHTDSSSLDPLLKSIDVVSENN